MVSGYPKARTMHNGQHGVLPSVCRNRETRHRAVWRRDCAPNRLLTNPPTRDTLCPSGCASTLTTNHMHRILKTISLLILLILPLVLSGCWETSAGERAGVVTRFSLSGAVFNTYEGELHYAGANGTIVADSWRFSIDAEHLRHENLSDLVKTLNDAQLSGKRVKITYRGEMFVAPWRGDTDHLIQTVEILP